MLGKIIHLTADAILISAFLAGVKRSTGLSVATTKIDSKDVRGAVEKYLNMGEWFFDASVTFLSTSQFFERKR